MEYRFLPVEKIASYLEIKRDPVYRWGIDKQMPTSHMARLCKLRKEEVDDWVESGGRRHPKFVGSKFIERSFNFGIYLTYLARCLKSFAVIIIMTGLITESIWAQKNVCDPSLRQAHGDPYGYRMRGDRCEGIYIKEVSTGNLQIASFTESFEEYDLDSGESIVVRWEPLSTSATIHLKANALQRRFYYQMDKIIPEGKSLYLWPSAILSALNLSKSYIGVVGYSSYKLGLIEDRVYLPLKIGSNSTRSGKKNYELQLIPDMELKEVFVTLAKLSKEGQVETYLQDSIALGYGYYPAERSIKVVISGLKETGLYSLELGATLRQGGSSSTTMIFSHTKN